MEPLWVPLDRRIEDNADNLHKARPGLERNCMSLLSIFAAWLCWWRNFKNTTVFAYGVTGAGKTHVSGSQPVILCLSVDVDVNINEKQDHARNQRRAWAHPQSRQGLSKLSLRLCVGPVANFLYLGHSTETCSLSCIDKYLHVLCCESHFLPVWPLSSNSRRKYSKTKYMIY